MAATKEQPAAAEEEPRDGWGPLDTAGLTAALILLLIGIDIWTDGKLISRRLFKSSEAKPEEPPSELRVAERQDAHSVADHPGPVPSRFTHHPACLHH
jgi:hypothetical protein